MLDELEKERLKKICPKELDFTIFLSLVQNAVPIGKDVYAYEEHVGKECFWCRVNSTNSDIEYEDHRHEKHCPIRISREYLYKIELPLRKLRLIALVEITNNGSSFLKPFDEIIYRVGEIETIEVINNFIKKILETRYQYIKDPTYVIRFTEYEILSEYHS